MKITELRCTACNGTLKADEDNPDIAICEYCKTRYVLEHDSGDYIHLSEEPGRNWYAPQSPPSTMANGDGWERYGWKRMMAGVLAAAAFLSGIGFVIIKGQKGVDYGTEAIPPAYEVGFTEETAGENLPEAVSLVAQLDPNGLFASAVSFVFGKAVEDVTETDLASFRELEVKYSADSIRVGYRIGSGENTDNGDSTNSTGEAMLTWIDFPRDSFRPDWSELACFPGLKRIDIAGYLTKEAVEGLDLERVGCYGESPEALADLFEGQTRLKDVTIHAGLESLEGIDHFRNLENLSIDGSDLTDIRELVQLTNLKTLTLENCDRVTDFSVLSVMPWLTGLSVDSEGLKDLGFLRSMPELQSFSVQYAKILNVDSIKSVPKLRYLEIGKCSELKDLSGLSGLTGLEELELEVPYGCAQPDLSGLSGLKSLAISGVESVSFLKDLPGLHALSIRSSQIDDASVFSGLTGLKSLTCSHVYGNIPDWSFVVEIPGLECLDLSGVSTYEDISAIFNIPTLAELVISGMECQLDFSNLHANESLTILRMDGLKLYTNVAVSGSGGITYVDYDPVSLDEHTDFLKNYPNLKELSIADNTLTNIAFASGLPGLARLDISGNYVTDLKPLESLGALAVVNCKDNPIQNYRVLGESVLIKK